jgi:hypothetical protein
MAVTPVVMVVVMAMMPMAAEEKAEARTVPIGAIDIGRPIVVVVVGIPPDPPAMTMATMPSATANPDDLLHV